MSFGKNRNEFRELRGRDMNALVARDPLADAMRAAFSSAKGLARAAGVSTRQAENLRAGASLPSAQGLIALMAESDEVFAAVCRLAGREEAIRRADAGGHLAELRRILEDMDAAD